MARFFEYATDAPPGESGAGTAGVSLRLLLSIRWVAVAGQALSLVIVHYGLGYRLPIELALGVVAASALINLANALLRRLSRRLGEREAALYLAYDVLQLGLLLYLTGGLENPFAILMVAPVTVAATILTRRSVVFLSLLAISAVTVLAVEHLPLPWDGGARPEPPLLYVFGVWMALVLSTIFIAVYAWSVAGEARRMRAAFAATQLALAREQRISAVGALAAAAAHELGSPLGTIAIIAKELVREMPPDSPHAEDAALLLSQSERCRKILAELAHRPEAEGASPYTRLPLSALVEAAGAPHGAPGIRVIYATTNLEDEPQVVRSPEILHGLGNLIQNAIQFARNEVSVAIAWDRAGIAVEIVDDGPGFPPSLLPRLGQPYLSGREERDGEAAHMGLGIFIAQTLLERTGARLDFANLLEGGGHVAIRWARAALEARDDRHVMKEEVTA